MNKSRIRLTLSVLIIGLSMFYLGWKDNQSELNPSADTSQSHPLADYFIKQSHSKDFNIQGQKIQELTSPFIEHLPAKERLELAQPQLSIYKDGQLSSITTSFQGEIPDQKKRIEFIGDVVVLDQQKRTIETERLTVLTEKKLAQTAAKVTISDQSGQTTGVGMNADLNANTLELHSQVKGLHHVN